MNKSKSNILYFKHSWLLFLFLAFTSLIIALLTAKFNHIFGFAIVILIIVLGFVTLIFFDFRLGFYAGIFLTSIMFFLERLIPVSVPYGVICDLLFGLSFVSLLLEKRNMHWKGYLIQPITLVYISIFIYQIFQIFNPNAISLSGWLVSLRGLVFILILFTAFALVYRLYEIKIILKVWILLSIIAACYAIYQEIFGLSDFEMRWVTSDPIRYSLYFIIGHMRKFSYLSDPSAFGVFMAYSALATFCLMFAPISNTKKFLLGSSSLVMAISMLFSGTRTAIAMLIIGILFFILISIRKKITFIVSFLLVIGFLIVMFGPFYNRHINRMRSTFRFSKDLSMEVRDVKRTRWQSYIVTHPIGGGLNTTGSTGKKYSAGHELAGGWDPDSGYLKIALEQGWIGLTLQMIFFFMVMLKGINNYFNLRKQILQVINLTFLVPFFAVTVANYTQNAVLYKPIYIFIIITYAIMLSIRKLDN